MVLPLSFLRAAKLALPFSLLAKSVLGSLSQNSAFNIKAHGTGFRYASSVSSDDIGVSTSDDLAVSNVVTPEAGAMLMFLPVHS